MLLLLDESVALRLESLLPQYGISASHVDGLKLSGADDPFLLALARREYDAIVTKDRYEKTDAREASLREMRDGLRIVELRFTRTAPGPGRGTRTEQLELILANLGRIEELIQPGSRLRKIVLNGSTGTVTKVMDVDDVAAEIARLGL